MGDVKRYDMSGYGGGMIEVSEGAFVHIDDYQSELAALREDLSELKAQLVSIGEDKGQLLCDLDDAESDNETIAAHNIELQQRLTAAEQRNKGLVGKVIKCKECGSDDLFWFAQNTVPNGIQQNRLNTNDVTCLLVLGCNSCSETLMTVSADKIADRMTAALKPAESGASE